MVLIKLQTWLYSNLNQYIRYLITYVKWYSWMLPKLVLNTYQSINQSKTFINTFICTSTCWNQKKIESVGCRTSKNKKMLLLIILSINIQREINSLNERPDVGLGVMVFNNIFKQYFSYIMEDSFIGRGNRSTWRKPQTCSKSLTHLIT